MYDDMKVVASRGEMDFVYTTTITDVCRLLQCGRNWVQRYIRPYVHYAYTAIGIPNAAGQLERDNIWLHTKELEDLVATHCICTRKTIAVPLEMLVVPEKLADCMATLDRWKDLKLNKPPLLQAMQPYLNPAGQDVWSHHANVTPCKRTLIDAVPCPLPEYFRLDDIKAIHTLCKAGRRPKSTETVCRDLYAEGWYRLELALCDMDGGRTNKTFYLPPKDVFPPLLEDIAGVRVTVAYADYLRLWG